MDFAHIPVLLEPCMELLTSRSGRRACSSMRRSARGAHGGDPRPHARQGHRDRSDTDALRAAGERLAAFGDRFCSLHGNYANIISLLQSVGVDKVDGVLMDLGVSSYQLDNPERGFSFHHDAPLDMRMDQSAPSRRRSCSTPTRRRRSRESCGSTGRRSGPRASPSSSWRRGPCARRWTWCASSTRRCRPRRGGRFPTPRGARSRPSASRSIPNCRSCPARCATRSRA